MNEGIVHLGIPYIPAFLTFSHSLHSRIKKPGRHKSNPGSVFVYLSRFQEIT